MADGADVLTHARWTELLGRASLGRRFYRRLESAVDALARSATGLAPGATTGDADALALLHTSRLLFLAFLEAKGWLDDDRGFLARTYEACTARRGEYHRRVLLPLFFGTLNTPLRARAPAARAFGRVPFLNGGLFARTALERRHRAACFGDAELGAVVLDLLGRHRFTAREDAAGWSEAAVDPEMLGRAFESLMGARDRRRTGAFYTPPALVAHAADAALRHALARPGRDGSAALPSEVVDDALAGRVDPAWGERVHARVAALRVLDPACGSGAFLVHALERLAALRRAAGDVRPVAEVRRDVLARAIFGVDVNPMAAFLCELRLWLSVVIDLDVDDPRDVPPLPNLDHNVRVGDALADGAASAPRLACAGTSWGGDPWGAGALPARGPADRRADTLSELRVRYAAATGRGKLALAERLEREERRRAIAAVERLLTAARHARAELLGALRARDLFGARRRPGSAERARVVELRERCRALAARRRALASGGALPFSFAAHFADVGAGDGFDAVVGNPPWVRPHALPSAERAARLAAYASCRDAAWAAGARAAGAGRGFGSQVDLAAPFVERALALLRPGGALALLVPAKLWRALAGGGLRRLLAHEARVLRVDDWSDAPAVFDAGVYPGLLVAERAPGARDAETGAIPIGVTVHRGRTKAEFALPGARLAFDASDAASPWVLLPADARRAFDALRTAGPTLVDADLARPTLGVKCGRNAAFVVRVHEVDGARALVRSGVHEAWVETTHLRPVVRGELLSRGARLPDAVAPGVECIVWTADDEGRPLAALPPGVAAWLAPWRDALGHRADARARDARWSLFRTEGARADAARVLWADVARTPRAVALRAGDVRVPLNSCYAARCATWTDARALAALLASPVAAAWLCALAEPARGGYRRFLAWTVALLPVPPAWSAARDALAALAPAGTPRGPVSVEAVAAAYGVAPARLAPLLAWHERRLVAPPGPAPARRKAVR